MQYFLKARFVGIYSIAIINDNQDGETLEIRLNKEKRYGQYLLIVSMSSKS